MDWHSEDIKGAIRKRGSTLSALAKSHGISAQALSQAILERSSARAEIIIAEFIGLHPQQIWPSRYDAKGTRLSRLEAQRVAA